MSIDLCPDATPPDWEKSIAKTLVEKGYAFHGEESFCSKNDNERRRSSGNFASEERKKE